MNDDSNNITLCSMANVIATRMELKVSSALAKDATKFGDGLVRGMLLEVQAAPLLVAYESSLCYTSAGDVDLRSGRSGRSSVGAWMEQRYPASRVLSSATATT